VSLGDQLADDFAGIVEDFGVEATVGGRTLNGVLSEMGGALALEDGGLGETVTSKFRYDPTVQTGNAEGFVPAAGARVLVAGRTFRVVGIDRGGSHRLIGLDLSQQR
jgi:hypothetical protein